MLAKYTANMKSLHLALFVIPAKAGIQVCFRNECGPGLPIRSAMTQKQQTKNDKPLLKRFVVQNLISSP